MVNSGNLCTRSVFSSSLTFDNFGNYCPPRVFPGSLFTQDSRVTSADFPRYHCAILSNSPPAGPKYNPLAPVERGRFKMSCITVLFVFALIDGPTAIFYYNMYVHAL